MMIGQNAVYYSNSKLMIPTAINELHHCIKNHNDSIIFAGGTYLMNHCNIYNNDSSQVIVDLSHIKEFYEITRNVRFVDVGCMVTANKLLEIGNLAFNDLLLDTLNNTATHIVRNMITVGGALCTPDIRYSLPGTLAIMGTSLELLDLRGNRISTKLIPINKLYNKEGEILLEKGVIIKKIRIALENYDHEKYFCVGNPIREPDSTVIMAFRANIDQTLLNKVKMCFTFPKAGMNYGENISVELEGAQVPLTPSRVVTISEKLTSSLKKNLDKLSDIQIERSKRMLQSVLFELSPHQYTSVDRAEY